MGKARWFENPRTNSDITSVGDDQTAPSHRKAHQEGSSERKDFVRGWGYKRNEKKSFKAGPRETEIKKQCAGA